MDLKVWYIDVKVAVIIVPLTDPLTWAYIGGLKLRTLLVDVETEPLLEGPWDLILTVHYLHRPLFQVFPELLRPGGSLVVIQPTRTNLQRHEKPPEKFLLKEGELPKLAEGLEMVHYEEGLLAEDPHDAVLVARRGIADQQDG